ncbi:MAG: hypothetical protein V2I34_05695 [Bacteroidales bacterium]|jgi:flavodoxin|nr:hypothetical protein [Bacteroidales bacterium]
MKKALVIYQSKNGTTRQFGKKIADYLFCKGIINKALSVEEAENTDLDSYDYVFLGCWTKGLMIIAQHPDNIWQQYVKNLNFTSDIKIGLFTTYKIATGTMFSRMAKCLPEVRRKNILELKSRNGDLPDEASAALESFIDQDNH